MKMKFTCFYYYYYYVGSCFVIQFHLVFGLLSFSSCPPPRFDTFSENLLKSWTFPDDDDDATKLSVQEVMRSCGGAVQGIREVPLLFQSPSEEKKQQQQQQQEINEEGIYLNRANDGWLFLDDGMYSCGPIQWNKDKSSSEPFLSNFVLSETSRLVVTTTTTTTTGTTDNMDASDSTSILSSRGLFLRKTYGGSDDPVPTCMEVVDDPTMSLSSVEFTQIIRCMMPSPGQPWMLQRSKWEKCIIATTSDDDDNGDNNDDNVLDLTGTLKYWTMSQPIADFSEWSKLSSLSPVEAGYVVHSGVNCESSGAVKVVTRSYDDSGALKCVAFLSGRVGD